MNTSDLHRIRHWFPSFVAGFAGPDGSIHNTHKVKQAHSTRVAGHCVAIASQLGWDSGHIAAAEALGLLHDVGRFPQFLRFGTLFDAKSIDHGELGREVVIGSGLLSASNAAERQAILCGICHHNRLLLPDCAGPEAKAFLKLVRDADKLDIIRVIGELVTTGAFRQFPELLLHIDPAGPVSASLVEDIACRKPTSYTKVKSLADMQLMHVSWIYDLNYAASCALFSSMRLLAGIRSALPDTAELRELFSMAENDLAKMASLPPASAANNPDTSPTEGRRCRHE